MVLPFWFTTFDHLYRDNQIEFLILKLIWQVDNCWTWISMSLDNWQNRYWGVGGWIFSIWIWIYCCKFYVHTKIEKKEKEIVYSPHDHWIFTHLCIDTCHLFDFRSLFIYLMNDTFLTYKHCNLMECILSLTCSCN